MESKIERAVTVGKWSVMKQVDGTVLLRKAETEIRLLSKDYGELSTAIALFDTPPADYARFQEELMEPIDWRAVWRNWGWMIYPIVFIGMLVIAALVGPF